MKKYKIAVRYENTDRGRSPFFDISELDRVKLERDPTYRPAISTGLVPVTVTQEERSLAAIAESLKTIACATSSITAYYQVAAILAKKSLSIREAAIMSGLSINFLKYHLKTGNLVGKKLGRSWRICPQSFERFMVDIFKET
ncbi:hypothetical protein Npun_F2616 [Nostoc punctiforme PCC 73102]|uniref:Helix-turn-helix domain-containing protein n=1 Tax=Nostoc punctiforme (strain ATCC 29133 / PCC 73102) TaxID=63737 RepID=B2ITD9_NOSP7|nr:hypothetical protein Npun_F2616 [Nostoc punctiforme PCC 73102]